MTAKLDDFNTINLRRGHIWMVDFGMPVGKEFGLEHPALIVSHDQFNAQAKGIQRVIVVPGTSTRSEVPGTNRIPLSHQEVPHSVINGLAHTTYFLSENVRSLSTKRLRRFIGTLEIHLLRQIDDRLCLVMDLFQPGTAA